MKLHDKRHKSTSAIRLLKIAKKVTGHDTRSNSFLHSKMKVIHLTVSVELLAVLESGENSKKAIIIPYGPWYTIFPPLRRHKQSEIDMTLCNAIYDASINIEQRMFKEVKQ